MSYIVTVTKSKINASDEVIAKDLDVPFRSNFECFKQEFPEETFNLSKFVTALNKPVRIRKGRTAKPTA